MFRLAVFVLLAASALATTFDKCKGGGNAPNEVRVPGCDAEPCDFVRGKNVSADIDFTADHEVNEMKAQSVVEILGGVVNYPLPEPDGCKSLVDAECPLEPGDIVTYHLTLPVLTAYPTVPLVTEISLLDGDTVVMCFRISGNVVD